MFQTRSDAFRAETQDLFRSPVLSNSPVDALDLCGLYCTLHEWSGI